MKYQIQDYITSISKIHISTIPTTYDFDTNVPEWTFYGDGQGDFEKIGNDASMATLVAYIEYCRRQIELAKEYINDRYYGI